MDIAFRVRNVEVPDSVRLTTGEKVTRLASWCDLERAEVCFSCERNPKLAEREICTITLFGHRRILRAEAAAADTAVAAERVVVQLEHRARRLRDRRLRTRRLGDRQLGDRRLGDRLGGRDRARGAVGGTWPLRPVGRDAPFPALFAGLSGDRCDGSVQFVTNWSVGFGLPGGCRGIGRDCGEATTMDMRSGTGWPMTPEAAALHMAAAGADLWFFANAETGCPGLLYRRRDGDIAVTSTTLPAPDRPPVAAVARS